MHVFVKYCFSFYSLLLFECKEANCQKDFASDNNNVTDTTIPRYNFQDYFNRLYSVSQNKYGFTEKSKTDFVKWQHSYLYALKDVLGLNIIEKELAGYVLKAEMKESEKRESFILQKWIIWTEPDVPIPIVVLIPRTKQQKLPLVITTHGHGRDSILYDGIYPGIFNSSGTNTNEEGLAIQAVKQGYIAISPTMRAFGSTRTEADKNEKNSFSCHTQLMRDLLVGRTVIGDRVWDMSKILDWALKNLAVDKSRIAITGNSGGGTVSLFAAACDSRITVAVPSSSFCTFTGSIGSSAQCDCNYIPGILNLSEMSDIAGLIAPRPVCFLNGIKDHIFPIDEARKAFSHLKKIYAASGHPENAELYEGAEGHQYYKEGAWSFIKKEFDRIN